MSSLNPNTNPKPAVKTTPDGSASVKPASNLPPTPPLPNWEQPQQVAEFLNQLPTLNQHCISAQAELMRRMEIDFHILGGKLMVCSLPVVGNCQTIGILHGGANAVLGETTGSVAANYQAPEGQVAVGSNIFINHHRPARQGRIYCVAQLTHAGKKLCHYQLQLFNQQGKLTASGTHTCAFITRPENKPGFISHPK